MSNIIKKIHRFIFPNKHYTNNVTKPLNDLEKGDKLYAMYLPDLEKKSISTSLTALNEVELEIATVDTPTSNQFKTSYLVVMFNKVNSKLLSGIHYDIPRGGHPITEFKLYKKDRTNTLYITKYNGILIITTDKNVLAKRIKQMFIVIGQRIYERMKEKEKNIPIRRDNDDYYNYYWVEAPIASMYSLLNNLKKTYSILHIKLLLM